MQPTSSVISADSVEGPLILSIDIGTTAVKAFLFDRLGRAVENLQWRGGFEIRTTTDGASEVDADALLDVVCQGLDAVLTKAGALTAEIGGVASCTFVGNVLGVDRSGNPLTPIYTYADTRAESSVAWLKAAFDEKDVHHRTGCRFHSSYLPARFHWLGQIRPDVIRRAHRWLSFGEYLELKLFGQASVSYSVASWSGLLNRRQLAWDEQLLHKLPIDASQLSPLVDLDFPKRDLRRKYADRWPQLVRLPWFPATGDGAAANIGSGCVGPSWIALTMGTTSAMRAVVDRSIRQIPEGLWCYRVDRRRSLPGGALSEGGNLFSWMKNTLKFKTLQNLESALEKLPPNGHGLTLLPFLSGERSPGWQGSARAAIQGISMATSPLDILHAGMEAIAYRIALVFQQLSLLLANDVQVIAGGGALRGSPAWTRIICNVMNRSIAIPDIPETSARGAALLAFEALGILDDLNDIPLVIDRTYDPDPLCHEVYRHALERHAGLYQKLVIEGY
jgi:gluconokinase